jgi:cell division protein FtsW
MLRGSIPPTGIPMSFISAGGTSPMVFMAAIGILCNVGKSRDCSENFKKTKFN